MDIIKVITKNNGVYLIKEIHKEKQEDVYYGYLINPSQKKLLLKRLALRQVTFTISTINQ